MKKTNIFGLVLILSTLLIGCAQPNMCADIPEVYTITCGTNNSNWGGVTCDKTSAVAGETITVTATPTSGYSLASISAGENITLTGNGNEKTFTMPASNVIITATFTQIYNITAVVPAGITVDKTNAVAGEEVTVTLGGNFRSIITGIIVGTNSIAVNANNTYTFNMPEGNVEITVGFDPETPIGYFINTSPLTVYDNYNLVGDNDFTLSIFSYSTYKDFYRQIVYVYVYDEVNNGFSGFSITPINDRVQYIPNNIVYEDSKIKVNLIKKTI